MGQRKYTDEQFVELENLTLLCPNCHALTATCPGKKKVKVASLGVATHICRGFTDVDSIRPKISLWVLHC